ncbi:uncharacterized protein LOC121732268 [Aricia agestis]|uniref:uncharacterized protein LOC121732268 n=1 Tax=Aricia agestis TaxID=91739 RepID=UPI001C209347|nr:uncharacterized protein LOC121732268 [Aricia agestis]
MTSEKLSSQKVKKLINCVMPRRYLWDLEDSNYKDKRMVAKGWNEVAEEMKMPMQMIRNKWKNLRDMYNRELRKSPGLASPEEYKGRWKYFRSLSFLLKPWEPIETQYLHDVMDTSYDEDDKAFIIKVGPGHVGNGDSSDRHDDDFDDDSEPQTKKTKSDDDDDDYDIMFLKSLAPYMRSLSPVRKLQVRNQIQEIFLEKIKK